MCYEMWLLNVATKCGIPTHALPRMYRLNVATMKPVCSSVCSLSVCMRVCVFSPQCVCACACLSVFCPQERNLLVKLKTECGYQITSVCLSDFPSVCVCACLSVFCPQERNLLVKLKTECGYQITSVCLSIISPQCVCVHARLCFALRSATR